MTEQNRTGMRISISAAASKKILEEFRENFARAIMRVEIDSRSDTGFAADYSFQALPDFGFSCGRSSAVDAHRTVELINNDDPVLAVFASGYGEIDQAGRQAAISNGAAILTTGSEPGRLSCSNDTLIFSFRFKRSLLQPIVGDLDDAVARPIPQDNPALRLLREYAEVINDQEALAIPELQHAITSHMYDLAALALGATRDGAETAKGRGVRAARLHAIKGDIDAGISQPWLSAEAIAARHSISSSYVRKLFQAEGTTFTDFVLAQRLARAHKMLRNPLLMRRSISWIAFNAGFNDLSYFNRTFRRRYGMTPSDAREASRGQ
jgi:AraC-like DNA-binding protein